MFLLETKHCNSNIQDFSTLFISTREALLQRVTEDDVIMYEILVPLLGNGMFPSSSMETDISMKIDDHVVKLFKEYELVVVTTTYIQGLSHGLCEQYCWTKSQALSWSTYFPKMACIMKIPELNFDIEYQPLEIEIAENKFSVSIDKIKYSYPLLKSISDVGGWVMGDKLKKVFKEYKNNIAIIYFDSDYPFCLEFTGSKKVYIAPCQDSE